jgi:hypothetical protein
MAEHTNRPVAATPNASGGYAIGPYRFTETDARKTVQLAGYLWDQFEINADGVGYSDDRRAVIAPVLPALTGSTLADDLAADLAAVWHTLTSVGPLLRAAGHLPIRSEGTVTHLASARGGVPKRSVDRVDVGFAGVVGDGQAHRVHHGRPWQALCIWSQELIDATSADGHPIFAGAAGENITIGGIDWRLVRPGVRLQIGGVLCEISAFAEPCSQNARWFADGDYERMAKERGPVSRAYATVLQPGAVSVGDSAILEP